jgi:hypothetical protein
LDAKVLYGWLDEPLVVARINFVDPGHNKGYQKSIIKRFRSFKGKGNEPASSRVVVVIEQPVQLGISRMGVPLPNVIIALHHSGPVFAGAFNWDRGHHSSVMLVVFSNVHTGKRLRQVNCRYETPGYKPCFRIILQLIWQEPSQHLY